VSWLRALLLLLLAACLISCAHSASISLGVNPDGTTCGFTDSGETWALDAPIDATTMKTMSDLGHGLDGELTRSSDTTGTVTLARIPGERAAHRLGVGPNVACAT